VTSVLVKNNIETPQAEAAEAGARQAAERHGSSPNLCRLTSLAPHRTVSLFLQHEEGVERLQGEPAASILQSVHID
jgi:hypothetical protein